MVDKGGGRGGKREREGKRKRGMGGMGVQCEGLLIRMRNVTPNT
jgi:hypothetical protein